MVASLPPLLDVLRNRRLPAFFIKQKTRALGLSRDFTGFSSTSGLVNSVLRNKFIISNRLFMQSRVSAIFIKEKTRALGFQAKFY